MNNYITQGTTITVQSVILKEGMSEEILAAEKEHMKEELIKKIEEIPSSDLVAEAARQLGVRQGNISSCCMGLRCTAYGFIWKYSA